MRRVVRGVVFLTVLSIVVMYAVGPTGEDNLPDDGVGQIMSMAAHRCGADCLLLRHASISNGIVFAEEIVHPPSLAGRVKATFLFPPEPTRYHRVPIQISPWSGRGGGGDGRKRVGYLQPPVTGAQWVNPWHTLADMWVMVFDTVDVLLEPLKQRGIPLWFITRTAVGTGMRRGCASPEACSNLTLFEPFAKLFDDRVLFLDEDEVGVKDEGMEYLMLGIHARCSPIPMHIVGGPACNDVVWRARNTMLSMYALPTKWKVIPASCPVVTVVSRQKDTYRRITPFDAMCDALKKFVDGGSNGNCPDGFRVVRFDGSTPLRDQLRTVATTTVYVAGRGGATALSVFLPEGGVYVSISGFDRWAPYRNLKLPWIRIAHVTATLVHHTNPAAGPQRFGSGARAYVDPNRAGYAVNVTRVVAAVAAAIQSQKYSR